MHILLVDDDLVSRKKLKMLVAPYGECTEEGDGPAALKAFIRALEARRPYRLVCLDIDLPGLSGMELLKRFRELEKSHGVPDKLLAKILMVSASRDRMVVMEARAAGGDAYLLKPFDRRLVQEKLLGFGFKPFY